MLSQEETATHNFVTLWQARGDVWLIERTYGGPYVAHDDAVWRWIKREADVGNRYAFFPKGKDPNLDDDTRLPCQGCAYCDPSLEEELYDGYNY